MGQPDLVEVFVKVSGGSTPASASFNATLLQAVHGVPEPWRRAPFLAVGVHSKHIRAASGCRWPYDACMHASC